VAWGGRQERSFSLDIWRNIEMVVSKVFGVSISLVYNLSARLDCLKENI
jgi:hypothetical protein